MYKTYRRVVVKSFLHTWHVAIGQKSFPIPYIEKLNLWIYFLSSSIPSFVQQTLNYIERNSILQEPQQWWRWSNERPKFTLHNATIQFPILHLNSSLGLVLFNTIQFQDHKWLTKIYFTNHNSLPQHLNNIRNHNIYNHNT